MSIPIHFHDLERSEESKSDVLIMSRGDMRATIRLGNLDRLRRRLTQYRA